MKIKNNKKNHKIIISIAVVLALLAAGGLLYVYAFKGSIPGFNNTTKNNSTINLDDATEDEKNAGDTAKQQTLESNKNDSKSSSDIPPAPQPQAGGKDLVEVDITAANQNEQVVQVRSSVGAVSNTGSCTITLSRNDKVITKSAPVQALPTTSTCQGFDIPVSELSVGTWRISLMFESATLTGTTSREITVK